MSFYDYKMYYTSNNKRMFSRSYPVRTPLRRKRTNYGNRNVQVSRTRKVNRRLFTEPTKVVLRKQYLEEIQHGPSFSLRSASGMTTYVTYPTRYTNGDGRAGDYIKVLNLKTSGRIRVRQNSTQGDVSMGVHDGIMGTFIMCFIRDKRPDASDGVNALPTFKDFFGSYEAAYGDVRVVDHLRERYRLMSFIKLDVSFNSLEGQRSFRHMLSISTNRYPIWASFKDSDPTNSGGNYKNISKNATLISYAWVSERDSTCQIYSQMLLSYLG
ncbi:BV1 [Cotton yellow mosaic virus]|uniref:Nuclear shuttle protein n=1 Tax=Cotton yellow mosaic virus TaxID=79236 RepID=A0A191ZS96_9GEMI|nr:BV1 [Cotton yellow mosaic virus]ANJ70962.1 BV1 [Cotton yellow mosaic virus]